MLHIWRIPAFPCRFNCCVIWPQSLTTRIYYVVYSKVNAQRVKTCTFRGFGGWSGKKDKNDKLTVARFDPLMVARRERDTARSLCSSSTDTSDKWPHIKHEEHITSFPASRSSQIVPSPRFDSYLLLLVLYSPSRQRSFSINSEPLSFSLGVPYSRQSTAHQITTDCFISHQTILFKTQVFLCDRAHLIKNHVHLRQYLLGFC